LIDVEAIGKPVHQNFLTGGFRPKGGSLPAEVAAKA
jgi:hypothetical protein